MPMPISAASSRRTSVTVLKARSRLKKAIASDIHILKLARCVFLPSMLADAVHIQVTVPLQAERRVLDAKQEFEQVSRLVKTEVARFEQERIEDFKKSLEHLLDGMITRQKETIQAWEGFQQLLLKKIPQAGSGTKGNTITSAA
jgi:esterase/lipase